MTILYSCTYKGQSIEISTSEKPAGIASMTGEGRLRPPGRGDIQIGELELSARKIKPGGRVKVSALIQGTNIAHILAEVMIEDSRRNHLYGPVWSEFLCAPEEEENQGVVYPLWGGENKAAFTFKAGVRLLSDGKASAFAFLRPEQYAGGDLGLSGAYIKPEEGRQYEASLTFSAKGKLLKTSIKQSGRAFGAPRAIPPQAGDQFTPFVHLLTPPEKDGSAWREETGTSNQLTFGKGSLKWTCVPAFEGSYAVGFAVKDLDGQTWRRFATVSVRD